MFEMNKFWERFFYLLTYVTQGSSYLTPRAYAILHRMHHAYSDTPKDPHSPLNSTNIFSMMWKTKNVYTDFLRYKVMPEERFAKDLPEWKVIDNFANGWVSRIGWGTFYTLIYIAFVPTSMWYLYLLLPIHYLMGPVHGAIVNWAGHKYGYRNFNSSDNSKNTLAFDFLMAGELFQNNHHHYPNHPNFAVRWFEFDPIHPFMRAFHWLGIIKMKPAHTHKVQDLNPHIS
jgi:stearoyl-CoA desaturase (delta-9 desaturase)